jgi:hypothetical protein
MTAQKNLEVLLLSVIITLVYTAIIMMTAQLTSNKEVALVVIAKLHVSTRPQK